MNLNLQRLPAYIERRGDGELVTDSRYVAEAFDKRHADVMRSIQRKLDSKRKRIAEFAKRNFASCSYDDRGRQMPCYKLTKDGLAELAMSFSGEDATEVRIAFLEEFNDRGTRLQTLNQSLREQVHALDRSESASAARGRVGSKLMHERKREIPLISERIDALMKLVQPSLFPALEQ